MSEEDTIKRTYEIGFLLVPNTSEADVSVHVDALKSLINKEGGSALSEGAPQFIDLAYTMEKNIGSKKIKWNQGYFGWIKFDLAPEFLVNIKKALDGDTSIIRYIILKTSVDNTIVFKKPKIEAKRGNPSEDEEIIITENESDVEEGPVELHDEHERLPVLEEDLEA